MSEREAVLEQRIEALETCCKYLANALVGHDSQMNIIQKEIVVMNTPKDFYPLPKVWNLNPTAEA